MSDILSFNSKRSVYFSFKNVPYSDYGVYEWSKRAENLIGFPINRNLNKNKIRTFWQERSFEDISNIADDVGACYLVDRMVDRLDTLQKPIIISTFKNVANVTDNIWGLWKFDFCNQHNVIQN